MEYEQEEPIPLIGIIMFFTFIFIIIIIVSVLIITLGWVLSMAFSGFTHFQATLIPLFIISTVSLLFGFLSIWIKLSDIEYLFESAFLKIGELAKYEYKKDDYDDNYDEDDYEDDYDDDYYDHKKNQQNKRYYNNVSNDLKGNVTPFRKKSNPKKKKKK